MSQFLFFLFRNQIGRVGWGGSHWEEALVAIVETQCCWKLGDMVELQASLWREPFSPASPSTIQGPALGTVFKGRPLGCSPARSGLWFWSTAVMWFRRSLKNSGTPSYPESSRTRSVNSHYCSLIHKTKSRRHFPRCPAAGWKPTRECVDVDHCMLTRLVVDDDVDAKQGHAQRLPQRPGQLPDHIVVGWLRHSLDVLSLGATAKCLNGQRPALTYSLIRTRTATVVRSEDDSGLDTLWLLKKMAFLSEKGEKQNKKNWFARFLS